MASDGAINLSFCQGTKRNDQISDRFTRMQRINFSKTAQPKEFYFSSEKHEIMPHEIVQFLFPKRKPLP